jgi:uncharacterized protein DUF5818
MKRMLTMIVMLGLTSFGFNLAAQQDPSPQSQQPGATQQQPADAQNQSAQSFEGKITKAGNKLVLQDSSSNAAYQLDDQDKAKQFKGQNVKVTATMDPNTNTLHVVDIAPLESK